MKKIHKFKGTFYHISILEKMNDLQFEKLTDKTKKDFFNIKPTKKVVKKPTKKVIEKTDIK